MEVGMAFVRKEGPLPWPCSSSCQGETPVCLQLPIRGPGPVWPSGESSRRPNTAAGNTQDWAGAWARACVSVLVQSLKCDGNKESKK